MPLQLDPNERVILFVDGREFSACQRALGFNVDFKLLLSVYRARARLIRAMYYTTMVVQDEDSLRPLVDWLEYNGFRLFTKSLHEKVDREGRPYVRGNTRAEMAVDAVDMADHADHFVFFANDASFSHAAAVLQRRGKRVSVVSTMMTDPPLVADGLRRQVDHFIDLASLESLISRDREPRSPVSDSAVEPLEPARELAQEAARETVVATDDADASLTPAVTKPGRSFVVERRAPVRRPKR